MAGARMEEWGIDVDTEDWEGPLYMRPERGSVSTLLDFARWEEIMLPSSRSIFRSPVRW